MGQNVKLKHFLCIVVLQTWLPATVKAQESFQNESVVVTADSDTQKIELCAGTQYGFASDTGFDSALNSGAIRFDTALSAPMLDLLNRQSDKELLLLDHAPGNPSTQFILGAQFRATTLVGRTNTADAFPYLGRFPTAFTGKTASDARILQANQSISAHLNPWVHGYFETLFSDVFTFPSFNQGSFQVRQAYVVLGDLNKSPVYGFLGKKNAAFGDFGTLSPFTQSMPWHYFAPLAEGIGLGYTKDGVNISVMGLNGGRGIRVADSAEIGRINNFALNSQYVAQLGNDATASIGFGYLHGTIYDVAVPEHIDPTAFGPRNGAWDVNARLQLGALSLLGEYVQTIKNWPATNDEVVAYQIEGAFDFELASKPARASISWSEGLQGPSGSEFEFNQQLVTGLRVTASENVTLTAEWVRSSGFAPLINIVNVSNRDVVQNSLVLGLVLAI